MKLKLWFALLAALAGVSCAENSAKESSIRKVKTVEVQNITQLNDSSLYPGKVVAAREVNRAFRVAGVVEQILVREGDFVSEGKVIAKMDDRDYKLQLAATEAEYAAIKGEVDRVVQLYNDQSATANDYDKATNGLKQIEAKLASHRNALADTELRAPFSGYIQKIFFDRGATVSAGMPILSIVSGDAPEVVVSIPANEYLKRANLISASATSELYPDTIFPLKHIGTTHKANLNQLYEARFRLDANADRPAPGMSLMVTLNYGDKSTHAAKIPFCAVVERNGKSMVWVIEGGKATLREVTLDGIDTAGNATITNGLNEGEQLITAGVNSLKEGQKVEPLPNKSESNIGNLL